MIGRLFRSSSALEGRIDVPPPGIEERFHSGMLSKPDLEFLGKYRADPRWIEEKRRKKRRAKLFLVIYLVAVAVIFATFIGLAVQSSNVTTTFRFSTTVGGPWAGAFKITFCANVTVHATQFQKWICPLVIFNTEYGDHCLGPLNITNGQFLVNESGTWTPVSQLPAFHLAGQTFTTVSTEETTSSATTWFLVHVQAWTTC